ncbi:MAG TPA: hypothetical protein VK069_12035, partial [Mycolicibacillus parakoreensis]|nr:hypothetical protein [Mycolicibacillus parakoreensis]
AFPMIGQFAFAGDMPVVLALTLLFGFALAAVSFALIEEPCRLALRRWEFRRTHRVAPLASAIDDTPAPAPGAETDPAPAPTTGAPR